MRLKLFMASLLLCCVSWVASADVLILKDGRVITGTFQGADQSSVSFAVNRQTRKYQLSDVNSITFTSTDQGLTSSTSPATSSDPVPSRSRVPWTGYVRVAPMPSWTSPETLKRILSLCFRIRSGRAVVKQTSLVRPLCLRL